MVYLDYAANTPINSEVLDIFCKNSMEIYGNPNAEHYAGEQARESMVASTDEIKKILGIEGMEIIYTSGASEANNLAIKGVAKIYRDNGKHIISTGLEHSSVSGALSWLQNMGYEIDLVDIKQDGTIDLLHLKELLRPDTILVSLCCADSELGVRQPFEEVREILRGFSNCRLHLDATQVIGKIIIDWKVADPDLVTFSPHKFYGLNGMGVLLRKEDTILEPLIHGGRSSSIYRSGTPIPAHAASIAEALRLSYEKLEENYSKVERLNKMIRNALESYKNVHINTTDRSLPHFINISVIGIKAEEFQKELNSHNIYVSTKSACSVPNTPSRAVFAVTKDKKIARCSWRISLSHLITDEEAEEFLEAFKSCYDIFKNSMK